MKKNTKTHLRIKSYVASLISTLREVIWGTVCIKEGVNFNLILETYSSIYPLKNYTIASEEEYPGLKIYYIEVKNYLPQPSELYLMICEFESLSGDEAWIQFKKRFSAK